LVTGGRRKASWSNRSRDEAGQGTRPWRSLSTRIVLLLVVFAALPAIVYEQLRPGDQANFYGLAIAYAVALGLLLWVLIGLLWNLRRLEAVARSAGTDRTARLAPINRLPDLSGVTREFDRMADNLCLAAEISRIAAAENAHAFKTPIATITHALTPLRNAIPADDRRARRSIELIQMTIDRLDALVMASRQMDETFAKTLHCPLDSIELSAVVRHRVAAREARPADAKEVRLVSDIGPGIVVQGNADLICTALDNIIDNAMSFTRPGGTVLVRVRREAAAALCHIDDEGPGSPTDDAERLFERYYTYRPATAGSEDSASSLESSGNFGVGLWIARRSIEAVGGKVWAERRPTGGMRIVITLPLARS
jgi:two-component system, OmpR family, sensor histidine kinase ChvG